MKRHYSRLAAVEEKKNIRNAILLTILSIAFLIFFVSFGLPTIVKISSFVVNLKKSTQPVEKNDTTPPGPPRIDPIDQETNKQAIQITGTSEAGVTVTLSLNNKTDEAVSGSDGTFSFKVNLIKGENIIFATAKDTSGNESQKSPLISVIYDDDPPALEISQPSDGTVFFGSRERQITLQARTESGAGVTINERIIAVDQDGKFTFTTTLSEGDNSFNVKATDKAGNLSEKTISVKFSL